jgi:hypothetical protein
MVSRLVKMISRLVKMTGGRLTEREGVGTSTIRTSTGQKFQNVEVVFLVDQNIENQKDQNVENVF